MNNYLIVLLIILIISMVFKNSMFESFELNKEQEEIYKKLPLNKNCKVLKGIIIDKSQ